MSQGKFFNYATRLKQQEKRNRDSWAKELSVTERTVTNFNQRLKKEFGASISKSNGIFGYYFIDKEKSIRYDEFINFINNLNSLTKIAESFDYQNKHRKHLIFHQDWNKVSWMNYFNPILSAINSQRYINVNFHSFRTEKDAQHMYFMPYWMKQNAYYRWYIIGFEDDKSTLPIVFGLDKINSIKTDVKTFKRKPALEKYRTEYENIFGVYIYKDRKAEVIRLECTRFQANYLKSLPLHPSQSIESENEETTVFKYELSINHEFAYELLRQNTWNFNCNMLDYPHPEKTSIRVLEPDWFADYFCQTYKRSFFAYANDPVILDKLKKDIDIAENPYPLPEF